jgi:hypothetical protein
MSYHKKPFFKQNTEICEKCSQRIWANYYNVKQTKIEMHVFRNMTAWRYINIYRNFRKSCLLILQCNGAINTIKTQTIRPQTIGNCSKTNKFYVCWPCISINPYNKNQLDALFVLSLFRPSNSTCFGHIYSPSSEGILYIYNN